MKKAIALAALVVLFFNSYGQTYNSLANYDKISSLVSQNRLTVEAALLKAGYKKMTYEEVCLKLGEELPKRFFAVSSHYQYTVKRGVPYDKHYVVVVSDKKVNKPITAFQWEERMNPDGGGKIMDSIIASKGLHQVDEFNNGMKSVMFYSNRLRHLQVGLDGTYLVTFTLSVNRGDLSKQ